MWNRYIVAAVFIVLHHLPVICSCENNVGILNGKEHHVKRVLLETNGSKAAEAEMADMMDSTLVNNQPIFLYRDACSSSISFCDTCSDDAATCYSCLDGYVLRDNTCGCVDPRCSKCTKSPALCEECREEFMLSRNNSCIPISRETSTKNPPCVDPMCESCAVSPGMCETCKDTNAIVNERTGRCECMDGYLASIRGCLRNPFSNAQMEKLPPAGGEETKDTYASEEADPVLGMKSADQPVALQQDQTHKNLSHPGFEYVNIRFETSTPEDMFQKQTNRFDTQAVSGTTTEQSHQPAKGRWIGKKTWKSATSDVEGKGTDEEDEHLLHPGNDAFEEPEPYRDDVTTLPIDLLEKKQLLIQMLKETDARIEELEANEK